MKSPLPFGKYLLLDRINVGGMAEVYVAKTFGVQGFERLLAIKRILPNMADDAEFINMFVDEARIAVQLAHANIVQIYELGKFENQYYIAMEYVAGKDLRQILDAMRKKKEVLPIAAAAFITSKICEGLDFAHRKTDSMGKALNLVHRDVSPQNILVSYEGAVKVTDFGIAKAEDRASKTQAGVLKGKFGYMSPEQVRGLEIDHRSDIFAVGILLYEMVTGKRLFVGESDFSTLERVRHAEVPPPSSVNSNVSEALERVMLKALAKERDERYQWASDLHDDLQQFLIDENTIFGSKKLTALLQQEFQNDIDIQRQKAEEFSKVTAPPDFDASGAAKAASADHWAEKTMVFEANSGNDWSKAPTQIASEDMNNSLASETGAKKRPDPKPLGGGGSKQSMAGSKADKSRSGVRGGENSKGGVRPQKNSVVPLVIMALAIAASITALVWVLFFGPTAQTGTIIITSSPTSNVQIILDGKELGQKTPLTRNDVGIGPHTLVARAAGFAERAYQFELVAGAPAVINIEFKSTAPANLNPPDNNDVKPSNEIKNLSKSKNDGRNLPPPKSANSKLLLRSKPDGATVWIAGTRYGTTPLDVITLKNGQTYALKLAKEGFRDFESAVQLDGRPEIFVNAELEREKERTKTIMHKNLPDRNPPPPDRTPEKEKSGGGACSGASAKLSVAAQGEANCSVMVGKSNLGIAPFFNKEAPSGRCEIKVECPSGKKYRVVKEIKGGAQEKLIVKTDMWKTAF